MQKLQVFLQSERQRAREPVEQQPVGMTQVEAETLAATIRARLPQAEVDVHSREEGTPWVVEARNPRRGTSQIFENPEQFEQLMQTAGQR